MLKGVFGEKLRIIDAHCHTYFGLQEFKDIAQDSNIDYSATGLQKELSDNKIEAFCGIYNDLTQTTPIGAKELSAQKKEFATMLGVGVLHPLQQKRDSLAATEKAIKDGTFKALKIYPGVYPVPCSDKRFFPYYELAAKHKVPVYVHTGDTFSPGLLRYARPLHVDEVAVAFPDTSFIMTQMGNPWVVDAAEVTYKNANVYMDTAGLFMGMKFSKLWVERVKYVIDYIDDPRKFLYGSDWPLVGMKNYIAFIKSLFPRDMHQKVFYDNARRLFKLS